VLCARQAWDELPDRAKRTDEYRRLTFYLHVYYAVAERKERERTGDGDGDGDAADGSTDAFRAFLQRRGAEFSAETEFLPYFALPYVCDPVRHPSFENLFRVRRALSPTTSRSTWRLFPLIYYSYGLQENRWSDSLRRRLEDFVLDVAAGASVVLVSGKDARKRKSTGKKFKTLYKEYKPLNGLFLFAFVTHGRDAPKHARF